MSQRLVALNDVLGALDQTGPLSSDALARRLRLSKFDARLVLVDAHAHGLVRTNGRGDWAITDRGRDALTPDVADDRRDEGWWTVTPYWQRLRALGAGARWREVLHPRYLARRGLPLALSTIVCAGGVAVASSRLEGSAGPPVVATTNLKAAAHGRHAHARGTRHRARFSSLSLRHHRRSTLVSTTGQIHQASGHVVRQSARPGTSGCHQRRYGLSTAAARLASSCTPARRGRPHSTAGGFGTSSSQRAPQNTGSGGSGRALTVPSTAGS
jgi:hypothetical protein